MVEIFQNALIIGKLVP